MRPTGFSLGGGSGHWNIFFCFGQFFLFLYCLCVLVLFHWCWIPAGELYQAHNFKALQKPAWQNTENLLVVRSTEVVGGGADSPPKAFSFCVCLLYGRNVRLLFFVTRARCWFLEIGRADGPPCLWQGWLGTVVEQFTEGHVQPEICAVPPHPFSEPGSL